MLQNYPKLFVQRDKAVKRFVAVSFMHNQKQAKSQKREVLAFTDARNNSQKDSLSNQLNAS
jgi:hypothetical protein